MSCLHPGGFASGRSGGGLIQVRCETNSSPGAKIPIFPVNTIKMVGVFHGELLVSGSFCMFFFFVGVFWTEDELLAVDV